MKTGFRTAMTWLHDWAGLVTGWLLLVIALAGTLGVFRAEIGDWARPEASCCATDSAAAGEAAVRWLTVHAGHAPAWYIQPADARSATSYAVWADKPGSFVQKWLDARTGSPAAIRDTLGGDFFYRLHFELQLPYPWGRLLAAWAALALLLVLVTGIVAHRRLFVDFFTFRPAQGQRSWLDAHNLLAVSALPFHLVIAFTGALTLANLLLPWGTASAYRAASAGLTHDSDPAAIDRPAAGRPAPLAPIRPMIAQAARRFGGDIATIGVFHPGDAAAVVTMTSAEDARIGVRRATVSFDGPTGRLLAAHRERRPAIAAYNFLFALHTARFAATVTRWLYFLSGLALTAAIGTGLLLWTAKRRQRRPAGFALVERLNLGFVAGTPIAFAAFLLANRLLPATLAHRAEAEVHAVFWAWGGALVFATIRARARAWREMTGAAALACLAVPVADVATGAARATGPGLGVDAAAAAFGLLFALAARRRARPATPVRRARTRELVA